MSDYYGDFERTIVEASGYETEGRVTDEYDTVCEVCGCDKVQEEAWVEINTLKFADWTGDSTVYCPDCDENVCAITRKEYEALKEEDDETK